MEWASDAFNAVLRFLSKYFRQNIQPPNTIKAKLTDLPAELLLDIAGYCDVQETVALSETCRFFHMTLYTAATRQWRKLSRTARLDFLFHMWWKWPLPRYTICTQCAKLHPVNFEDLPGNRSGRPRSRGPALSSTTPNSAVTKRGCFEVTQNTFNHFYELKQHHITFALGNWFPDFVCSSHLECRYANQIMQPVKRSIKTSRSKPPVILEAQPRIIDRRFILITTWTFPIRVRPWGPICPLPHFRICPHLHEHWNELPIALSVNMAWVLRVRPRPEKESFFHCKYCHTEYSFKILPENMMRLRVYQYLGKGHVRDEFWDMQTEDTLEYWVPQKGKACRWGIAELVEWDRKWGSGRQISQ